MALVGINPVQREQKESTLDKILKGVQIAQGVMGTAIAIPEFLQKRDITNKEIGIKQQLADQEAALIPVKQQEAAYKQKTGGLEQTIKELTIKEKQRELEPPDDSDKALFLKVFGDKYPLPTTRGQTHRMIQGSITTPQQAFGQSVALANLDLAKGAAARAEEEAARKRNAEARDPISLLPSDDKREVFGLVDSNVKKVTIGNQLQSYNEEWDAATDEKSKLDIGRKMLKILNSTEGADAIGKEEADRLGAKLKFAIGNFTNDNPIQFGRDLEGFRKDAEATVNSLKGAVSKNKNRINDILKSNGLPIKFDSQTIVPQQFPRQVTKDGNVATVSNETELQEALSEGWK